MEFKCGSWKVMESHGKLCSLKSTKYIVFFAKKIVKTYTKMKDDFQGNGEINLAHGKLGEVMEKVMESHGILKAEKTTNPLLY